MGERCEPRQAIALPVRIWGMDRDGRPFLESIFTANISRQGARLEGVQAALKPGAMITVQAGEKTGVYTVVWVGAPGGTHAHQAGIAAMDKTKVIWNIALPGTRADDFSGPRAESPAAPVANTVVNTADVQFAKAVSVRVQKAGAELRQVESLLQAGMVEKRVLQEFREAVDQLRRTGWAAQQWVELQVNRGDPAAILRLLKAERVRAALQISRQLAADIREGGVPLSGAQASELAAAIHDLDELLRQQQSASGKSS